MLKSNTVYRRRDGRIAGPFVPEPSTTMNKSRFVWLCLNTGLMYDAEGHVRFGNPSDDRDVESEAPEMEYRFVYRNHRGEIGPRRVIPQTVGFSATQWHPQKTWLLTAIDIDKSAVRMFDMKDILGPLADPQANPLTATETRELVDKTKPGPALNVADFAKMEAAMMPTLVVCAHCQYAIPCKCGLNKPLVQS